MRNNIHETITKYSNEFDNKLSETTIILAAGHGKRIKSHTSKMLHKIWEKPTVERVFEASKGGLKNVNSIIVVGIKAKDVIKVIGSRSNTMFAYQETQNGTGHAVQVALENIKADYDGTVYILPGDMGLIDSKTISNFKRNFVRSGADMMVLTGIYEGDPQNNNYGRIVRVKDKDVNGNWSGEDKGKVIEIIEHKDILSLDAGKPYITSFKGKEYSFTKEELIKNNEFNSGVYAVHFRKMKKLIGQLDSNNVQGEIYITDLISVFNNNGLTVRAVPPREQHVLMGFNNKSVLLQMENIARDMVYDKLKDIVVFEDPYDFFIHEDVVEQIMKLDKKGQPLDIIIGKGAHLGKNVKVNYNLTLMKNACVRGDVKFGKNITVSENVHLSTHENQTLKIGDNVEVLWGNIIKGNIVIGDNSRIESSVNMTGSDEFPLKIGKNVTIKGTSYIFGSIIEDDVFIEHSILIKKKVEKLETKNGDVRKIRFYLPMPEGIDSISDL
ncbi:MAG: NTP transferase domain-containing protein [Chlorobi bacterium]|nr:NTP transferase domain-containing protein [Chlorobiota bacterium]